MSASRQPARRRTAVIAVAIVLALVATTAIALVAVRPSVGGTGAAGPDPATSTDPSVAPTPTAADPQALASAFLDEWVDADGRVVRRDQGGDTVSEGQAYGLLLAVAADDEAVFDRIWTWTQDELQREDGLLSWRWADGGVVDDEPASDAELDAARALVLAGERFARDDLRTDGAALATALLDEMTVETGIGRVLLPGLWAVEAGAPYAYNPSYASPAAYGLLEEATGDARWTELAEGSAAVTTVMLATAELPPDWAQVHPDGRVEAMPGPAGRGDAVAFGYDAARMPLRYAESCDPADRALAASTLDALLRESPLPAVVDLGGGALTEDRHPLTVLARAAASAASGDTAAARDDLLAAETFSTTTPTYYGRAWTALAAAMLRTDVLGSCPALPEETP